MKVRHQVLIENTTSLIFIVEDDVVVEAPAKYTQHIGLYWNRDVKPYLKGRVLELEE